MPCGFGGIVARVAISVTPITLDAKRYQIKLVWRVFYSQGDPTVAYSKNEPTVTTYKRKVWKTDTLWLAEGHRTGLNVRVFIRNP